MTLNDSCDVLQRVVERNSHIEQLMLARFKLLPPGDQRASMETASQKALAAARAMRSSLHLPFWDAVMTAASEEQEPAIGVFTAALFHNPPFGPFVRIAREDATAALLRTHFQTLAPDELVTALSAVMVGGVRYHIPMIDFHVPDTPCARVAAREMVRRLKLRGCLLLSGKSFHFIGYDLIAESQLSQFLGKILLFSPIVDRTWIAHQLIEGSCALRISGRAGYGGPPSVLEEVADAA